ncbi:hypothetical protein INT43_000442 [Umbelopsis isabellina]|uniref:ER membrane protein complex subunit 7 beta-sandwich domain-containing protein n=1 Tax=Mortierella isabellina TaxID=91625 RepID=A0A8H7Q251_MORIS|nr:hypothetical protein INT43_000442 [Umbelopsis isabellina]
MLRFTLLFASLFATVCWAVRLEGSIAYNSVIQDTGDLESTASALLNGGEYSTLVRKDGKFVFPEVPNGNYFLEIQSVNYMFPKIRVDINDDGVTGAYSVLGSEWDSTGYDVPYPFMLKAKAENEYFMASVYVRFKNMCNVLAKSRNSTLTEKRRLQCDEHVQEPNAYYDGYPEDMEDFNKAQVDAQKMMSDAGLGQLLAWAVALTSTDKYVNGIIVLASAFEQQQSKYPLVVLYTPQTVSEQVIDQLADLGCDMIPIEPIVPKADLKYLFERFSKTWTKLRAWQQTDYERLVLMDADMLPLHNMDELMTMTLEGPDWVAASHACTCNPQRISHYPKDWTPSTCAFTGCDRTAGTIHPPSMEKRDYFNSGLVVLTPNETVFKRMLEKLDNDEELMKYCFPDQDFLNDIFKGHWVPLPYSYNALKTLPTAHHDMWDLTDVKNIHYILTKPWDIDPNDKQDIYYPLYRLWWKEFQLLQSNL